MAADGSRKTTHPKTPRVVITPGEPAGIGPELVCQLALRDSRPWVVIADPSLMADRAKRLGLDLSIRCLDDLEGDAKRDLGELVCLPIALTRPSTPGELDTANVPYVLTTLECAARACLDGQADAVVTGPIHKGIINEAGVAFSGHTEFFQAMAGVDGVVMMLTAKASMGRFHGPLRVALVTTHLPLKDVAQAITAQRLEKTLTVLVEELQTRFGIATPRLMVLGLNPHAGEGGHLGHEEIEVITPTLERLRQRGWDITGPLPADTAFVPAKLESTDVVVAMYHDQGLPVLKHLGFGQAVNITLGLGFVRTSVDHGTALEIAGRGEADVGSLQSALDQAFDLVSVDH